MKTRMTFLAAALAILAFTWGPAADAGAPPKNKAPVVSITVPANGSVFPSGTLITFTGTASDNEDGDLTGAISWSSSVDGQFGTGGTSPRC